MDREKSLRHSNFSRYATVRLNAGTTAKRSRFYPLRCWGQHQATSAKNEPVAFLLIRRFPGNPVEDDVREENITSTMEDVLPLYAVRLLENGRWQVLGWDSSPVHPAWRVYTYADERRRWYPQRPGWPEAQPPVFD
jgi:hypothetical protein